MASIFYTDDELEAAKEYLRDRLRNERSMTSDLENLLAVYAGYLLSALFDNVSEDAIERIIQELIGLLIADCETLAVDEHDRKDTILLWLHRDVGGDTIDGRVDRRVNTFFNEVYAVYLAGRLMNLNKETMLSSIKANLKKPWDNEILVAAREKVRRGEIEASYGFDEPHFGKGVEISSFGALDTILTTGIADAWMYWGYEDALARGAKGYFVERGSSYPCAECDSHCGVFHYITDEDNRPQFHAHCCCYIVYSYTERL